MAREKRSVMNKPAGAAETLAKAMAADGIDLTDAAAINAWINEFNARPYDDRAAVLNDDSISAVSPVSAIELPDEDEARSSTAHSPLLAQARLLVDFLGEGRKLTQTGNVSLADARHLVSLLATGDRFDETIGARTFKTHSASDLPQLSFIVRVTTAARLVRSVKGKLVSTKAGRSLGRDPLADLQRIVGAIEDLGLVTARTAGGRYIWTTLAPFFDDLFVPLTVLLLTATRTLAFDEIVERAFELFEDEIDLDNPHWDQARRHDFVESEIRLAISTLEAVGAAAWASEVETSEHGTTRRRRGTVALTPAGRWVLHRYLGEAHAIKLPVAQPAEFTDHDFGALITACETAGPDDFGRVTREISAWIEHRGDQAIIELTSLPAPPPTLQSATSRWQCSVNDSVQPLNPTSAACSTHPPLGVQRCSGSSTTNANPPNYYSIRTLPCSSTSWPSPSSAVGLQTWLRRSNTSAVTTPSSPSSNSSGDSPPQPSVTSSTPSAGSTPPPASPKQPARQRCNTPATKPTAPAERSSAPPESLGAVPVPMPGHRSVTSPTLSWPRSAIAQPRRPHLVQLCRSGQVEDVETDKVRQRQPTQARSSHRARAWASTRTDR